MAKRTSRTLRSMQIEDVTSAADVHDFLIETCKFQLLTGYSPASGNGEHVYAINDSGDTLDVVIVDKADSPFLNEQIKKLTTETSVSQYQMMMQANFQKIAIQRAKSPAKIGRKDRCRVIYNAASRKEDTKKSILAKINGLRYESGDEQGAFNKFFDVREIVDKFYADYEEVREQLSSGIMFPVDVATQDRDEYATTLMNRLVFTYFLQTPDPDGKTVIPERFLQSLFEKHSSRPGQSYYHCLCHLWFDYFNADRPRMSADGIFECIPYLNGGLFARRSGIEDDGTNLLYPDIDVPDETWEAIFMLLDGYTWTIVESDEDDEEMSISPSILGHIYEKQCNQKDTGSYYTPDHVTTYIARECIVKLATDRVNGQFGTTYANFIDVLAKDSISPEEIEQVKWFRENVLIPITICDNACGSGAFLLAAEKILVDLHQLCNMWIGESSTLHAIKRHVVTRNLYGVDLQSGSVEIAKLRLWLSMIPAMQSSGTVEPLPNIDYNILAGNSLVGFVKLPDKWGKSLLSDPERLKRRLAEYRGLKDAFRSVTSSADREDLKEKIDAIRAAVRAEMDALLKEDLAVKVKQIDALKSFHWAFEFEEVFSTGGFDIIIGNPPYVRADTENDFHLLQRSTLLKMKRIERKEKTSKIVQEYKTLYEKWDVFVAFIERSLSSMVKKNGYFGYIVSDALLTVKYASKVRAFILDRDLKSVDFFKNVEVFRGIGVNPTIVIVSNKKPVSAITRNFRENSFDNVRSETTTRRDDTAFKPQDLWILDEDYSNTEKLGNICYISVGMVLNANEKTDKGLFSKDDLISNIKDTVHNKPYVEGDYTGRYKIKDVKFLEWNSTRCPILIRRPTFPELYEGNKILRGTTGEAIYVEQEIKTNHGINILKKFAEISRVSNKSITMSISKWNKGTPRKDLERLSKHYQYSYLLVILNSRLGNVYLNAIRRHKIPFYFYPDDLKDLPIKKEIDQAPFMHLMNYLQFLYVVNESKAKELDDIVDDIVTEIYFGNKIHGNASTPLLDAVKQFISPIDFAMWSSMHWKVLTKEITPAEHATLDAESERIDGEIGTVMDAMVADPGFVAARDRVRQHETTKRIAASCKRKVSDDADPGDESGNEE